jgi:uncharacterized protein
MVDELKRRRVCEPSAHAAGIIAELGLQSHPEGGWYRETYRSETTVESPAAGAPRSAMTDIYFLLRVGEVSRFHRVLHDEVWNYYEGAPLRLHLAAPDGTFAKTVTLGPRGQADALKRVVHAACWQAAESTGEYTLAGCTVAPGFDFADFSFLRDVPEAAEKLVGTASELSRLV